MCSVWERVECAGGWRGSCGEGSGTAVPVQLIVPGVKIDMELKDEHEAANRLRLQ